MSEIAAFPYIEVEGDPVGIGLSYGRQAVSRIEASLDIYRPIFEEAGLSWDQALSRAAGFLEQLDVFDAEQCTELRAIAQAAGVKAEEIMLINARTDIIYGSPNPPGILDDGCTGAIAMPNATADGHVIHAQNWDWRSACKESVVIVKRRPSKGPKTLNLFEAGTLARCGLNEHGIAMTANFLQCDHDPGRNGVPSPFVRRRALSSNAIATAAEHILIAPRSFSNNIMLSDAGGIGLNFETTPKEYYWSKPEDDLLVHANHFTSPAGRSRVFDTGVVLSADSLYREDRVRDILSKAKGEITIKTMLNALADDFGSPFSVNRPPSAGLVDSHVATVASIVMDVTARTMTVVAIPYAQSTSTTYALID